MLPIFVKTIPSTCRKDTIATHEVRSRLANVMRGTPTPSSDLLCFVTVSVRRMSFGSPSRQRSTRRVRHAFGSGNRATILSLHAGAAALGKRFDLGQTRPRDVTGECGQQSPVCPTEFE